MGDRMIIDPEQVFAKDSAETSEKAYELKEGEGNTNFHQAVEPQGYSQQELIEFLNDPEERKNAVSLAMQIQQFVGKNWFTFSRFLKKTKETHNSGQFKLKFLVGFGLLQQKMGTWKDGKESRGMVVYKVVISKEDKIIALDEVISFHKEEIEKLERQKQNLQAEK